MLLLLLRLGRGGERARRGCRHRGRVHVLVVGEKGRGGRLGARAIIDQAARALRTADRNARAAAAVLTIAVEVAVAQQIAGRA